MRIRYRHYFLFFISHPSNSKLDQLVNSSSCHAGNRPRAFKARQPPGQPPRTVAFRCADRRTSIRASQALVPRSISRLPKMPENQLHLPRSKHMLPDRITGLAQGIAERAVQAYPLRQAVQRRGGRDVGGIGRGQFVLGIGAHRPSVLLQKVFVHKVVLHNFNPVD